MRQTNTICQARADRMPDTYQEKKPDVGGEQEESGLWKDKLLIQPKFAKKAAQFMKSLGLIDQFKSVILE